MAGAIPQAYDLYSPFQYPWMTINYFLVLWFFSLLVRQYHLGHLGTSIAGKRIVPKGVLQAFHDLSEEKKRNCITYVIEIVVTTFAFVCQIYGGMDILFRNEDYTEPNRYNWMIMSVLTVAVLYVWELCYREKIGWPLLVHHLCTILLCQLVTASYFDTANPVFLRFALLLGFHATTEQTSFVALYMFRLNLAPRRQAFMFYCAAAQSLVVKTAVTVACLGYYVATVVNGDLDDTDWQLFWEICFVLMLLPLYLSQLYACKILYVIGKRCSDNAKDLKEQPQASSSLRSIMNRRRSSEILLSCFETSEEERNATIQSLRRTYSEAGGIGMSASEPFRISRRRASDIIMNNFEPGPGIIRTDSSQDIPTVLEEDTMETMEDGRRSSRAPDDTD